MPLYDYRCKGCSEVTTVLEKCDSRDRKVCPGCGGEKMEKLLPVFGVGKGKTSDGSSKGSSSCAGCSSRSCGSCSCH